MVVVRLFSSYFHAHSTAKANYKMTMNEERVANNNNSILYYLCAMPTAARPITDTAQCKKKK
jgi:hypothetical protein